MTVQSASLEKGNSIERCFGRASVYKCEPGQSGELLGDVVVPLKDIGFGEGRDHVLQLTDEGDAPLMGANGEPVRPCITSADGSRSFQDSNEID